MINHTWPGQARQVCGGELDDCQWPGRMDSNLPVSSELWEETRGDCCEDQTGRCIRRGPGQENILYNLRLHAI